MVTISLDDDLREELVEEYGEETVSQYEEGLHDLGELIYGDVMPLEIMNAARSAHQDVSKEKIQDLDPDSFQELMEEVEDRLDEFEGKIRKYAAQEYLTTEIETPDEI